MPAGISQSHTPRPVESAFVQGEMDETGCARGNRINGPEKESRLCLVSTETLPLVCLNSSLPLFLLFGVNIFFTLLFQDRPLSLVLVSDVSTSGEIWFYSPFGSFEDFLFSILCFTCPTGLAPSRPSRRFLIVKIFPVRGCTLTESL